VARLAVLCDGRGPCRETSAKLPNLAYWLAILLAASLKVFRASETIPTTTLDVNLCTRDSSLQHLSITDPELLVDSMDAVKMELRNDDWTGPC